MSAQKEHEVLMHEIEAEEKKEKAQTQAQAQVCAISKSGITIFGFHVSWMVVILIAILVFFWLNHSGMLPESIKDVLSESESTDVSSVSKSVAEAPKVMTGGFKANPFSKAPGQVRQMMGH